MHPGLSLRELVDRGVLLQPHEAVAVAQQLIASLERHATPIEPLGPPTLSTVHVCPDGEIVCHSAAMPAVFEMAMLLDAILKAGTQTHAGALRYAIARALMEVDAPPFESIAELSTVLVRYERGDRRTVLRALYARGVASARGERTESAERRRSGPSVATLRRQLRDADRALFERQHVVAPAASHAIVSDTRAVFTPSRAAGSPAHVVSDATTPAASTAPAPAPINIDFDRFLDGSRDDTRTEPAIHPRTALAAILLSMATGYAVVYGYQQIATSAVSSPIAATTASPPSATDHIDSSRSKNER
jgi:hypothetical protein